VLLPEFANELVEFCEPLTRVLDAVTFRRQLFHGRGGSGDVDLAPRVSAQRDVCVVQRGVLTGAAGEGFERRVDDGKGLL
jgi:hypothetical protein